MTRAPDANVRVLHIHSGNLYGGVETLLRTFARYPQDGLATMDYALCFDGKLAAELREAGAVVRILGKVRARSPRRIFAVRRELARVLRETRYDVVVCHSVWSHALFAPVIRAHDVRLAHFMHDVPDPKGWLDRWANLTSPDLVLCNSAFTKSSGPWLFPAIARRVVRCPLAMDGAAGASRAALRSELGVKDDTIVVLQVSRMHPLKGHRLLIDALSALRSNERWTCWIVGGVQQPAEARYYRDLAETVDRLGLRSRITFLGQRNDVQCLMRAADVYCQPNVRPETFGLTFVEALAAGLPIVTTAIGGALEIVGPSNGTLVPPTSFAIAAAIARYVDGAESRAEASASGPSRARELCDVTLRTREFAAALVALVNAVPTSKTRGRVSILGRLGAKASPLARRI